jgi:AraC-like DNA-binding protein
MGMFRSTPLEVAMLTTPAIDGRQPSDAPLLSCPQFSTTDPDEAVFETAKVIAPHQMDISGNLSDFRAYVRWADFQEASLCYLDYHSPLSFYLAQHRSIVSVVLPLSGDMSITFERGDSVDVPRGSCAVIPASDRLEMRYQSGFSGFVLYAPTSALCAGLRRIAPEVDTDGLVFDAVGASEGRQAGTFYGLTGLLVDVVDQYDSPEMMPPNVVHALNHQIISTFLFGLSHSRSQQVLRSVRPLSSRIVRLAVDVIRSDEYAQKTVTDVAKDVGVSIRSLELGFRREFACTPHEYIQKYRLQCAHDQLTRARPGDGATVTEVAMRWGFNHTGRFSALYRRVYGAAPSETLRASAKISE